MTIITGQPIYQGKSLYKNGKRYELEELSYIFDCPHCEYVTTTINKESAETILDIHYFHHHPEVHVPLIDEDRKERIERYFTDFRIRSFSAVGGIKPPAK